MKRLLKCCVSKNPYTKIKYNGCDDHNKAFELINYLRNHYK